MASHLWMNRYYSGGCVVIFTVVDRYILHDFFHVLGACSWAKCTICSVWHSAIKLNKFGFKIGWQAFPSHKNRFQLTPLQCSVLFFFFQKFFVHQFSHNNLCRTQFFILLYFYSSSKCLLCCALATLVLSFCTVRISRPSVSYLV